MYDILSDFIYWLNCNIVSSGITITQNFLFLHAFLLCWKSEGYSFYVIMQITDDFVLLKF